MKNLKDPQMLAVMFIVLAVLFVSFFKVIVGLFMIFIGLIGLAIGALLSVLFNPIAIVILLLFGLIFWNKRTK